MSKQIAIIGAGLVGSLQAVYLAKKGYDVHVFERRRDMRKADISAGRSINLALSDRGWKALQGAGIEADIREIAIPMYGRMMHAVDGTLTHQAYGMEGQAIYSVSRGGLNARLMDCAEAFNNVHFYFNHKCTAVDLESGYLDFEDQDGKAVHFEADHIFGTDGAFSAIRARLQKTDRFNYSQFYLPHGYKELSIPPTADGGHQIDKNALHIWPRGEYMLIALANQDGSFTCTLFFPFEGDPSFTSLQTKEEVNRFFGEVFPDTLELIPNLAEEYFNNPTSSLVTIKCAPWHYQDKILLMGDASHAIVPFYGQGMNSGFEDCSLFNEVFEAHGQDMKSTFASFSASRKADADAISDLALQNFIEMRDLVGDPSFLLRKKIEKRIFERHPDKWMPLYSQVTFSHIPYSQALANGQMQAGIMDEIMKVENIEEKWNSDEIEAEILRLLADA